MTEPGQGSPSVSARLLARPPRSVWAVAALWALSQLAVAAVLPPPGVVGRYSQPVRVCLPVADGHRETPVERCQRVRNTAQVSRLTAQGADSGEWELRIGAVFPRGHVCFFRGVGPWYATDRLVLQDPATGCRLTAIISGRRLHTVVMTEEACSSLCGASGSLDALVFSR